MYSHSFMSNSKVGGVGVRVTEHLWQADDDKSPTARRSATHNCDEEGNPNQQRVAQEGDKEKDVVRANLGELDEEQDGFSGWAFRMKEKHRPPLAGMVSPDDRKWL